MSNIPSELKYVSSHEWLRLEADGTVTVGITEHAQELLGDIVFVELPEVGANLVADEQAGVVESVKAASDVYAPIAGEVVAVNQELVDAPETARPGRTPRRSRHGHGGCPAPVEGGGARCGRCGPARGCAPWSCPQPTGCG